MDQNSKTTKSSPLDRREFIRLSTLIAIAVSTPLYSCRDHNEKEPINNDCQTTADILGPYYKAGAPLGENIIPAGVETPPLMIAGKVFSHCEDLLPYAVVEIWNANADGRVDRER